MTELPVEEFVPYDDTPGWDAFNDIVMFCMNGTSCMVTLAMIYNAPKGTIYTEK